ncbi:MAG: hypothetical protein ACLPIG_04560 [Methylocella sp.]
MKKLLVLAALAQVFAAGTAHGRAMNLQKDQFSARSYFVQSRPAYEALSTFPAPIVPKRFT